MQDVLSRPKPPINPYTGNRGGGNQPPRPQGIVIAAITLFALSGLLLGFAVGTFTRPKHTQTAGTTQNNKPVIDQTMAPKASPTVDIAGRKLGCPILTLDNYTLTPNNTVSYTLTAQAVDKSAACQQGKPIYAAGITCKLWLIKASDNPRDIPNDRLTNVTDIANPMPHEIQNGLTFDPATPQTQQCNGKGQGKWKYGLTSSVDNGSYFLMVLTDWQGKRFNWSWVTVSIKKADN